MIRALLGALLVACGIAAQIVAGRHMPQSSAVVIPGGGSSGVFVHTGWSQTAYDLVRIGGWALLVFGAVIVLFALVGELRKAS
jgi:hypothetical protein